VVGVEAPKPGAKQSGRLELAEWMTRKNHPLTARVLVNRLWHWHFGTGLSGSPDNFGLRGEAPTHPELLDWMATELVEKGWSMKHMHTIICTSATYRQAMRAAPAAADPENRLLGGWPRRRLEAEAIRDGMLAVSGRLDATVGGPLMTVLNRTYATGGNAPPDIAKQMHYDTPRRSLYLPVVRNALYDFLAVFDYPEPGMLTGRRSQTTVAPQALYLMNSAFVQTQAGAFAERLTGDDAAKIQQAYESVYSRRPTEAETKAALAFLAADEAALTKEGNKQPRAAAWKRLGHALLASNEFLYLK
jgi:hypothetical protein